MQSAISVKKIEGIVRKEKFAEVDNALKEIGIGGLTFFDVEGRGRANGIEMIAGRGAATYRPDYVEHVRIEVLVNDTDVERVVDAIATAARTGQVGDGKIIVISIDNAWDITSGNSGLAAI